MYLIKWRGVSMTRTNKCDVFCRLSPYVWPLDWSIIQQLGVCPSTTKRKSKCQALPSDHLYRLPVDHCQTLHIPESLTTKRNTK